MTSRHTDRPHYSIVGRYRPHVMHAMWPNNCVYFIPHCLQLADSEEDKAVYKKKHSAAGRGKNDSSKCYYLFVSLV